jgi:DNA-binding NarL/FixJ family response regulator
MKVLLVDDHELVRQGIRLLLEAEPGIEVVGEAADAGSALRLAEELRPTVAIVDLSLGGAPAFELIARMRELLPRTRVVVLSMHAETAYVSHALAKGATAYVVKGASAASLLAGIRSAAASRTYLSPPLREAMVHAWGRHGLRQESLTARERQVLDLSVEGLSAAEIAERLGISRRTVESHRYNLMKKLGVTTRAELVRAATERRMLDA